MLRHKFWFFLWASARARCKPAADVRISLTPSGLRQRLRRWGSASRRIVDSRPAAALLILAALLSAPAALAHELSLVRFELGLAESAGRGPTVGTEQNERPSYRLLVMLPGTGSIDGPERLGWPEGCQVDASRERFQSHQVRLEITFSCVNGLASDAVLSTPWGQDGAVFTSYLGSSRAEGGGMPQTLVLAGRRNGVEIPLGQSELQPRSLLTTAGDYAGLGMFHILEGFDHLAFVLCLCLLVGGRSLLLLVTAFTVGHSASLALAYLGYINFPMRPVEAVIALSVAFMAREAIMQPQPVMPRIGMGLRYPAVVAGFGLLHGLGFASELEGLGISAGERITGLVTFNIGVEIGQLLFVGFVLFLQSAARLLAWQSEARLAALAGAGVLGMYWFTERVISLF